MPHSPRQLLESVATVDVEVDVLWKYYSHTLQCKAYGTV
jgi:hypothetical protein